MRVPLDLQVVHEYFFLMLVQALGLIIMIGQPFQSLPKLPIHKCNLFQLHSDLSLTF